MRLVALPLPVVVALLSGAGCTLYLDGDDDHRGDYDNDGDGDNNDDSNCELLGAAPLIGVVELRNPQTGTCDEYSGGGGSSPCPQEDGDGRHVPAPTWGMCESDCTGLDELSCITADACRAIYMDWCPGAGCPDTQIFSDCWPTDTTGPLTGDGSHCEGLDAETCSLYSDCSAAHDNSCDEIITLPDPAVDACVESDFNSCQAEKVWCYEDAVDSCGEGYSCNAADLCLPMPDCTEEEPGFLPCPCAGYCVPDDSISCDQLEENACIGRDDCTPLYEGPLCEGDDCEPPPFYGCIEG